MEIEMVAVDSLRPAPYNAPSRMEPDTRARLKASIERRGVLDPLKVTPDGMILDGHRRWLCARELGMGAVPIVRVPNDPELYAELADTSRRMTGKEAGFVILHGGIPTRNSRSRLERIRAIGGDVLLRRLVELNIAAGVLSEANRAGRYCGVDVRHDNASMYRILTYLIEGRRQAVVHQAISAGVAPAVLWDAICSGRELRAEYR